MKISVASACWRFVIPVIVLSLLGLLLVDWVAGAAGIGVALVIVYFFRDPERTPPGIRNAVLAPADGRIVGIERVTSSILGQQETVRISIFMSLLDVHVNRAPIAGVVNYVEHCPGKFLNAMKARSADVNEHTWIGLQNGAVHVLMRQIAGVIARRIISYCQVGDTVKQGDRVGLICFGSRVETYVPVETSIKVHTGMKVHAGRSVLGILSGSSS
jgi:phosphatidylserine decarboxylase